MDINFLFSCKLTEHCSDLALAVHRVEEVLHDNEKVWTLFGQALQSFGIKTIEKQFIKMLRLSLDGIKIVIMEEEDAGKGTDRRKVMELTHDKIIVMNPNYCRDSPNDALAKMNQLIMVISLLSICLEITVMFILQQDESCDTISNVHKAIMEQSFSSLNSCWKRSLFSGADLILETTDDNDHNIRLMLLKWNEYYEVQLEPLSDTRIDMMLNNLAPILEY